MQAPPSPSAALLPKTPPESPAIFHYSLPSPGLHSPLSAFAVDDPSRPRESWVEQVDFSLPEQQYAKPPPRSASLYKSKKLPSLDQITARLSGQASGPASRQGPRRPAFLQLSAPQDKADGAERGRARPALPAGVGRLHFPVRAPSPPTPTAAAPALEIHCPSPRLPPSPCSPKLQVRTTVVPRTSSFSPVDLTESNLRAFEVARQRSAQNMLTRLKRRTASPDDARLRPAADEERKLRRHSAPPELPMLERAGFVKPVLNLPGAF